MRRLAPLLVAACLAGCAAERRPAAPAAAPPPAPAPLRAGLDPAVEGEAFPGRYRAGPSEKLAITGATLLTGTGAEIPDGTVIFANGRIEAVGSGLPVPAGYRRIDAKGRWVTPGIIDAHSHLGVWGQPDSVDARVDVNELTDPNTAQVWAEHSLWPQDPGFDRAREAGVTTLMLLPGSGNLFGGRTVTIRNVPAITAAEMKFPGAPQGLKIACGENPLRTYGGRGRSPSTRMGNVAGYRKSWIDAAEYRRRWDAWRSGGGKVDPPRRDLQLDTLSGVLRGELLVQNHCYRSDEMAIMIDIAREFGFKIRTFHHANEAYKIAPMLAREGICVATWTNWWGYKMEVYDAIEENAAMVHAAGGCAIIHSDDAVLVQHLNQEAAEALSAGRRAGLSISEGEAIRWITANPAKALGIDKDTGTLEPGKRADLVLWNKDPFSIYALAERVWIDGAAVYSRDEPASHHLSDFLLGQAGQEGAR